MVRVGDVQQELYLVNTDLTTLSTLTEFLITSELDTLPNGLWQEHTVIQWSYPREKLVCHTWTRWQHEDKIIRCWHGYVGGSHPTKTSNVELTQIEKKAKPNANNETQCSYQVPNLTSHKQINFVLNSSIPLEVTLLTLCMQLPISRSPHIIFPAIKPSRNMVLLIECLNIIWITPRILLFISDLVNGFNDDKKSLEILSKSTLHGMGNSSTGLIR